MKTSVREQRLSARVRFHGAMRFRVIPVSGTGFRDAFALDVSEGGVRFQSRESLPRRASLMIQLDLPGYAPLRSLARAVWVRERPSDEGYEVGAMFVEPPHDARATLARLVSEHRETPALAPPVRAGIGVAPTST